MRKNWISYVGTMVLLFGAVAFFGSDLSMVIGAVFFAVSAAGMPLGANIVPLALCIGIFTYITGNFVLGLLISLGFIIPGILTGIMIRKKVPLSMIIGSATFARFVLLGLYYYRISLMESTTVKELLTGEAVFGIKELTLNFGHEQEITEMAERFTEFMGEIIPAVFMISSLSFCMLTLLGTKIMVKNTPLLFKGIRRMRNIKMDISFTLGAIILFVLMFFAEGEFFLILVNLNYFIYVIYLYAGFAFIFRSIKRVVPSSVLSVVLTLVLGMVSFGIIYVLAGIIGSFIPLKDEIKKETN